MTSKIVKIDLIQNHVNSSKEENIQKTIANIEEAASKKHKLSAYQKYSTLYIFQVKSILRISL
jgi:hypothetical protein